MNILNRYLVFGSQSYQEIGGWGDFLASYRTLEAADLVAKSGLGAESWTHVIDGVTGERLKEYSFGSRGRLLAQREAP